MAVLDELLVAIGLDAGDLTNGAADAARDVERDLNDIRAAGAGADVGGDFLDALTSALAAGDMDAQLRTLLDADAEARRAGDDAGDALADGIADGAQQGADEAEGVLSGIDVAAAGAVVGGTFLAGMQSALDLATVQGNISDQLGLTAADAQRAGQVAGDIYSAGFGGSLEDVQAAIVGVGSSVADVSSLSDAELTNMSKSALALASTFDVDVTEAAGAAATMIRNGLVNDGTEAFDLLTAAAGTFDRRLLADIPAVITEYSEQFQRLGLDGATAFGMMSQFVEAGGRDIDQAADVIHEFGRIAFEETDRASAAFRELGMDAGGMLDRIHAGGPDAAAAMGETLQALRDVKDPADQARLAVELFGDMAGESSDALLAMDPAGAAAQAGLDDAAGAAKSLNESMEGSPAQQMDAAMRQLQTTLGEALLPIIMAVSRFMSENKTLMQFAVPIVLALATAIGLLVIAQWAYNAALAASGVGAIIMAIGLLVAGIIYLATQTTFFQDIWTAAWGFIRGAAQAVWDWIKQWWPLLLGIITGPIGIAVGLIVQYWDEIQAAVGGAIDWITEKVGSGIGWVEDRIGDLASLPGEVAGWFGDVGSTVADSVSGAWRSAMNAVIGGWNSLSIPLPSIDLGPLGSIGGGSIDFPDIPYLAEGGITTGPTLAMVGEGPEREAILPLSQLDSMLSSVAGAVARTGGDDRHLLIEWNGPRELIRVIDKGSRKRGGNTSGVTRRGAG